MRTRLRKATGVQPGSVARVQLLSETVRLGWVHRVYPFVIAGSASTLEKLLWVNTLARSLLTVCKWTVQGVFYSPSALKDAFGL